MRNPFLKNRTSIFLYGTVWGILWILQTVFLFLKLDFSFGASLTDAFVSNALFAIMGLSYWYTVRFISLDYFKLYLIITNHIMASCVFIGLFLSLNYAILSFVLHENLSYVNFLD